MTGRDVLAELVRDPDNAMAVNFATTGLSSPVGVLEIAVLYPGETEPVSYFVEPQDTIIPSDLNFQYTGILRHMYDDELVPAAVAVEEILSYVNQRDPEVLLINNEWWMRKLMRDQANVELAPLFASLGRLKIWEVPVYETARVAANYTLFDTQYFETFRELRDFVSKLAKQVPYGARLDLDKALAARGLDPVPRMTLSQVSVETMRMLYERMLEGSERDERHVG